MPINRQQTSVGADGAAAGQFSKLSVLMPVYNEIRTIRTIVHRVLNAPVTIPIELVAVDDASTDGTREVLAELAAADARILFLQHERNQGKAGAIRTAIRHMTGDLALVQDADLEYNPADYPLLLRPMLEGIADAVFGSRFLTGNYRRVLYFWHSLGNYFLTFFCNLLNNINLTDMETGYKLIRADILRAIPLTSHGFAFEPELTTKLARWNLRLYEVPISYQGRTYAEGKKIGWKDLFKAFWAMVKYRFFSTRFTTHDGFYVLDGVKKARGFNRWMIKQITPYLGESILEAGCGIGNLTELLLTRSQLTCVDNNSFYVDRITQRFGHLDNVAVINGDIAKLDKTVGAESVDTIVCLNVLEHIEDDCHTLENFFRVLQPGGNAIILVPAHPWLYTTMDKAVGHYRRYRSQELVEKIKAAGFEVASVRGFNRLGSLGWFVSGKLFRPTVPSSNLFKLFELLLPLAKIIERLPVFPYLSIIAIARKPANLSLPARKKTEITQSKAA